MPSGPIDAIRNLVRRGQYRLSSHVVDKIANNEFEREDVEYGVLTGDVVESQRDEQRESINRRKYIIRGRTRAGIPFESVGKLVIGAEGRQYFFITAYEWE